MTHEEKQLLLKDLCARLPYSVKLGFKDSNLVLEPREYNIFTKQLFTNQMNTESNITVGFGYEIHNYLPYLRPMSSMTEEEWKEYNQTIGKSFSFTDEVDWLNAHHFDYRGLIPMGLALKATKGMYEF